MLKKIEKLSEEHLKMLIYLSVFGNDETSITSVLKLFKIEDIEDEKNVFLEYIYDLQSNDLIKLYKDKYFLPPKVLNAINEKNYPNVFNCAYIIELFKDILKPSEKLKLEKDTEILLLKTLYRIKGQSADLAVLNDYYAQYLNSIKKHRSAVDYFQLAVEIQKKVKQKDVALCNFYNHLSETYMILENFEKSLNIAFKSVHLTYQLPSQDHIVLIYSYTIISNIYFRQKKYELAFKYSQKAIKIAEEKKLDKFRLANLYLEASILSVKIKNIEKADFFIEKTLFLSSDLSDKNDNKEFYQRLYTQKQYINLLKRMDNTIYNNKKILYLILFFVLIIIIVITIFFIF